MTLVERDKVTKQQDLLEPYNRFDEWTQRTGILSGGGLTWIVRIPLNILFILVLLARAVVMYVIDKIIGKRIKG